MREFDSIPDREVPAATGDGSPTSPDGSSTMMNGELSGLLFCSSCGGGNKGNDADFLGGIADRYAPAQGTNVLIAKTIRAAIADMKLS